MIYNKTNLIIPFLSLASIAVNHRAKRKVCQNVLGEIIDMEQKCEVVEVKEVKEFIFKDMSRVFNLSSHYHHKMLTSTNNSLSIDNGKY